MPSYISLIILGNCHCLHNRFSVSITSTNKLLICFTKKGLSKGLKNLSKSLHRSYRLYTSYLIGSGRTSNVDGSNNMGNTEIRSRFRINIYSSHFNRSYFIRRPHFTHAFVPRQVISFFFYVVS